MAGCRCAPALIKLRDELSFFHPGRDRASDGCCASARHTKQNPTSDHEPGYKGATPGYAHAYDLDEDIAPGNDLRGLWQAWTGLPVGATSGPRPRSQFPLWDPRIKYLIYERRIAYPDGTVKVYTGPNAHDSHLHVSIQPWATFDTSSWFEPIFRAMGTLPAQIQEAPVVAPDPRKVIGYLDTPERDGGWVFFEDGSVWTLGNAQYLGGANQQGHLMPGDVAMSVVQATLGGQPVYGYRILTKNSPIDGYQYTGTPKPRVYEPVTIEKVVPDPTLDTLRSQNEILRGRVGSALDHVRAAVSALAGE